ncbi:hypothetical protein BASA81_012519 [Batrachochytrium salamandrivorans]|nr:hypothetical protein BASA81_012519 [Batrachochytrium salamandrivorans]
MRMNVTFVNSANTSTNSSNRSLRASPVFMPLYSTLVSAFTSVSNAPLKFNALLLNNETKTTESLSFALKHYYINQVKRQLFSIAGSSDILGSPVQLLGGVSHGVFSFFYEPALALSMGGGEHIGAGLSRGSSAMVNNSAGSLLESLAKVTRAVARTLATSSGDHAFASWIDAQLNFEGFREPVNLIEGANRGALVLIKSLVDAVFAMFNSPHQVLRHFAGLLLKPASGFFGLLAQFSCGVRNTLVDGEEDALLLSIPVRLAKPRELTIVPYSASRCAGYMLASARYGKSAKLITSCVCQVEQIKGSVTLLTVAKLVLTDTWLAACREVDVDVFALPVECVERFEIQAANHQVTLSSLGRRYVFTCLKPVAMKQAWEQAFWLKTGKRASSSVATTTVQSLQRMVSFHKSEIDVSELRVRAATIQSFGAWEDGITRYHVLVVGSDDQSTWTVERRYREFLDFRDRACEALGVSRRCMPLPSRKAWVLGPREHEERKLGLQRLLDLVLTVDLLRESEVLREFVCRGAENVHLF